MKIRVSCEFGGTVQSLIRIWFCAILVIECSLLPGIASSGCSSRLLADRQLVPDTAFTNSSAINPRHSASAARDDSMDPSLQERAWCPLGIVHTNLTEFLQVDLGRQVIIKLIITKGRVAQSKGFQTTPFFTIRYKREVDGPWFQYQRDDKSTILNGNRDAMTENYITMEPPVLTRFIRIHPYSKSPTTTCLKLELLGCEAYGVVEYQIPQGTVLTGLNNLANQNSARFQDTGYDGHRPLYLQDDVSSLSRLHAQPTLTLSPLNSGNSRYPSWTSEAPILTGGLGKLYDNDTDSQPATSHKFVGWKRHYLPTRYDESSAYRSTGQEQIRLQFRFDELYNFTSIRLFVANDAANSILSPNNVTVQFGAVDPPSGKQQTPDPRLPLFVLPTRLVGDLTSPSTWIHGDLFPTSGDRGFYVVPAGGYELDGRTMCVARFVEIRLFFDSHWMAVGEVAFENNKVDPNEHKIWLSTLLHHNAFGQQIEVNTTSGLHPEGEDLTTKLRGSRPTFDEESSSVLWSSTTFSLIIVFGVLVALILCGLLAWICTRFLRARRHHVVDGGQSPTSCCPFHTLAFHRDTKCKRSKMLAVSTAHFDCQAVGALATGVDQDKLSGLGSTSASQFVTGNHQAGHQHANNNNNNNVMQSNGLHSAAGTVNTVCEQRQQQQQQQQHLIQQQQQQQQQQVSQSAAAAALYTNTLMTPHAFMPVNLQSLFNPGYPHCDIQLGNTYRRVLPLENGVYTSPLGSDCDSQPYARVVSHPGQVMVNPEKRLPRIDAVGPSGGSRLIPLSVPPPPSLPLPPTPSNSRNSDGAMRMSSNPNSNSSSSPSEMSGSTLATTTSGYLGHQYQQHNPGSGKNIIFVGELLDQNGAAPPGSIESSSSPLIATQTDPSALWSATGNRGNPSYYLPVPNSRRPYDLEERVLLLPSQPVVGTTTSTATGAHLGQQQHIWPAEYQMPPVTGSDYSTVTMGGSSNNAYGPFYGTPRMFPRPHVLSGTNQAWR